MGKKEKALVEGGEEAGGVGEEARSDERDQQIDLQVDGLKE